MTTPQWECLAGLYTQLSIPAGCIYKEGETAATKHSLPKHATHAAGAQDCSLTGPSRSEGFGEGWSRDAGFASSLGQKETLSHCLPPGPQAQGRFWSYQS